MQNLCFELFKSTFTQINTFTQKKKNNVSLSIIFHNIPFQAITDLIKYSSQRLGRTINDQSIQCHSGVKDYNQKKLKKAMVAERIVFFPPTHLKPEEKPSHPFILSDSSVTSGQQ